VNSGSSVWRTIQSAILLSQATWEYNGCPNREKLAGGYGLLRLQKDQTSHGSRFLQRRKHTSLVLLDKDAADTLLKEKFKDADSIPADLRTYVATAVQANLIQGDDAGNFAPTKTITRAEIAALLDRLLTSTAATE
jgi:hypothetical protein